MEIDCVQRNDTFKFKLTLDRRNAGLKLIYCLLPDPPRFSLPSTFNTYRFFGSDFIVPWEELKFAQMPQIFLGRDLKVLTNEKRGGFQWYHSIGLPFSYSCWNFQTNWSRPHPRTLFLLFAIYNCFPITLYCRAATYFSHHTLNWNNGIVHPPRYLRSR